MALNILHTADWHIGQIFHGFDRSFEHESFLTWLVNILESRAIDVLLVSGDIFDTANPSAISQKIFYHFLQRAKIRVPTLQIIITAGNHDSAARLEAPNPLFANLDITVVGIVPRDNQNIIDLKALIVPLYDKNRKIAAWCMAVPFLRLGDYPSTDKGISNYLEGISKLYDDLFEMVLARKEEGQAIIAMGHLHTQGALTSEDDKSERTIIGGMDFLPAESFNSGIAYLALGHIHKAQIIANNSFFRYSGSPLPMSFSEVTYHHHVVEFTLEEDKITTLEEISVPVVASLKCIPEFHEPLSKVLDKINALPSKTELLETAPYLEIRVLLNGVETSLKHTIETALNNKHARLARIDVKYANKANSLESKNGITYEEFKKMDPLFLAESGYKSKFGVDMPKDLSTIFQTIIHEVKLDTD